jgi:hypothetical protein
LTIFCDGARSEKDKPRADEVRKIAGAARGFGSVKVVYRSENLGLAKSIVIGVSEIVAQTGRIIVVEDDLITSPYFLRYMNEGLSRYADTPEVASVHGYVYPLDLTLPESFFIRGADCWGWATWARAWKNFEPDANKLLTRLRERRLDRAFDFGGAAGYLRMLEDFLAGKNDSWAVRWHAATYLCGMLTLYPGRSLIQNIGIDGSGIHSGDDDVFNGGMTNSPIRVEPIALTENLQARAAFERYFRSLHPTISQRVRRRLRRILGLGAEARK